MLGTSKEMIKHILDNKDKVIYDLEKGIITTAKGTNGAINRTTGYLVFKLSNKTVQVHTFLGVMSFGYELEGMTINHIDGNKTNNKIENLEVISHSENVKHQWANGLAVSNCGKKKLTDHQANMIKENFVPQKRKGVNTIKYFAELFEVSPSTVRNVVLGVYY